MTRTHARFTRHAVLLPMILLAVVASCGKGSEHAAGDTGTVTSKGERDLSATPNVPDSTTGVANPTGQPAAAGDTMGARARDSSKGPNAGSPAGGRP